MLASLCASGWDWSFFIIEGNRISISLLNEWGSLILLPSSLHVHIFRCHVWIQSTCDNLPDPFGHAVEILECTENSSVLYSIPKLSSPIMVCNFWMALVSSLISYHQLMREDAAMQCNAYACGTQQHISRMQARCKPDLLPVNSEPSVIKNY